MNTPNKNWFELRAELAAVLGDWRCARGGLAQKVPAIDLNVSPSLYSMWESGQRFPHGPHLQDIHEYTGLRPCHLLCRHAAQCLPVQCPFAASR